MELWYAVNKSGQGRVFTVRPERNEYFGVWVGTSLTSVSSLVMQLEWEGFTLPSIKWSDDPVRMTLSLGY